VAVTSVATISNALSKRVTRKGNKQKKKGEGRKPEVLK
jgi:hypothetical protein